MGVKLKNPSNPKERNLLKGAIRRVFSRSETRRAAIDAVVVDYLDPKRPRVKKWAICALCQKLTPKYLLEADHIEPVVPLNSSLEEMTWDELIDRVWNGKLNPLCKECHKSKTKEESKLRKEIRKREKENE